MPSDTPFRATAHDGLVWDSLVSLLNTLPAILDERVRATTGLTHFQFSILATVAASPDAMLHAGHIARAIGSSPSRVSHTLSKLAADGLVERRACDTDRRATWISLTDDGKLMVTEASAACEELKRDAVLAQIPAAQRDTFAALLQSLLTSDAAQRCEKAEREST